MRIVRTKTSFVVCHDDRRQEKGDVQKLQANIGIQENHDMIPPDGLHTNADYPPEAPVLSTPGKVTDYGVADFDRRAWVLTIRPALILAGNLVETEEHREEFRAMTEAAKKEPIATPSPLTQAVRTPAGDFVPPPSDGKFMDTLPYRSRCPCGCHKPDVVLFHFAPCCKPDPVPVDRKSLAAVEKEDDGTVPF